MVVILFVPSSCARFFSTARPVFFGLSRSPPFVAPPRPFVFFFWGRFRRDDDCLLSPVIKCARISFLRERILFYVSLVIPFAIFPRAPVLLFSSGSEKNVFVRQCVLSGFATLVSLRAISSTTCVEEPYESTLRQRSLFFPPRTIREFLFGTGALSHTSPETTMPLDYCVCLVFFSHASCPLELCYRVC